MHRRSSAALHRPIARLGHKSKCGRRRQRSPVVHRNRVEHQRNVATPTVTARVHRPQHAVQHRDHPRQVSVGQVGPHHACSLATTGDLLERVIQTVETSGVKDPALRAAVNRLCSRAPSDIAARSARPDPKWIGGARAASIRLHLMRVQSAAFFRTYASAGTDMLPLGYDPLSSQCHWHWANAPGG